MILQSAHRAIVVAFVIWFGSYAYLYIYRLVPFKPLYSYFALLGYLFVFVEIFRNFNIRLNRRVLDLIVWLLLYLIYGCLAFFNSAQNDVAVQGLVQVFESMVVCLSFLLIFSDLVVIRRAQAAFTILGIIATVVNVYDFFYPVFSKEPGRAAGLYVNPNIAGQFIAMAMVAGIESVPLRGRLFFVLGCGIGVLLTFSRAAWILWGVAVLWLGLERYIGPARNRILTAVIGAVIGIGFVGLVFTGGLGKLVSTSSIASYLTTNTSARLGIDTSPLAGRAARERISLIWHSLRTGIQAPLIGHGLGYTDDWQFGMGTHNMYLMFFVEGGVLGVLLYLALIMGLWRYSVGVARVITIQLIIAGIFTHNQLDQPVFLMIMAFVVAHSAVVRPQRTPGLRDLAMANR